MKAAFSFRAILLALLLANLSPSAQAEPIHFFQGSWEAVLQEAQISNKSIFVDFYTTWCKPCKWMSENVFTDPHVGAFFNRHFISYKVNAEAEAHDLVVKSGVNAYPTLVFYTSSGEIRQRHEGTLDSQSLLDLGRDLTFGKASGLPPADQPLTQAQQEQISNIWNTSKTDPVEAMGLAKTYLSSLPPTQLTQINNWEVLTNYGVNYQTPAFKYFAEHAHYAAQLPRGHHYLERCMGQILKDAVAKKDPKLLARYKAYNLEILHALGQDYNPESYYSAEADRFYYSKVEDWPNYMKATTQLLKSYAWSTSPSLSSAVLDAVEQVPDKSALTEADLWVNRALELEDNLQARTAALILCYETQRFEKGLIHAEKAYEYAEGNAKIRQEIQSYITLMGG